MEAGALDQFIRDGVPPWEAKKSKCEGLTCECAAHCVAVQYTRPVSRSVTASMGTPDSSTEVIPGHKSNRGQYEGGPPAA